MGRPTALESIYHHHSAGYRVIAIHPHNVA